jgi:hypothetical protein
VHVFSLNGDLSGKGRGVVCTEDLDPGDIIMVCQPLALFRLPEEKHPDAEGLVDLILEQGIQNHR